MSYTIDDLDRARIPLPKSYIMNHYERDSLKEIKKMLSSSAYRDRETAEQHLLFLEHLSDKLQNIMRAEQGLGESSLILRRDIDDIRKTFTLLTNQINNLT